MNKAIMMGRLTKDPEIRYTADQKPVASFGIAVNRLVKKEGGPEADFFNCTAWGKTAELMQKYWKKGMKALLTGHIENEKWTGKDGTQKQETKIIVETIEFCEKRQEQEAPAQTTEWSADEDLPFKF